MSQGKADCMRQHGLHNPKQSCNLKDINTTGSGPGEMLISSANRPGLGGSHPPHSALARSSSRWLTGSQILSLRLPQTNQGLPSGQHGAPTTGKLSPPGRESCASDTFTQREPLGSLLAVVLIITIMMILLMIINMK